VAFPLPLTKTKPMLAKAVHALDELPAGDYLFEPKWDGFRCLVFVTPEQIDLRSRNQKPMARYFPELLAPLREQLPATCVVDGELVIAGDAGLEFDALQQRLHPAESRVELLAEQTPASFIAFDLLWLDDRDRRADPFAERRDTLERALGDVTPPIHLTPMTTDRDEAADWFVRFEGAGLDGVMAKPAGAGYLENKRTQFKVKHRRTADCAVAGYRMHKSGDGVGSLLLGLYDDDGALHHVGVATSFSAKRRVELLDEVDDLRRGALEGHPWREWADFQTDAAEAGSRMPGGLSRWNAQKDLSWEPLRVERVAEVGYENVLNGRFRHSARLVRWRTDRDPDSCTYAQLEQVAPYELGQIFGTGTTN
jgi:ATP-dependent DNA ligase